MVSGEVKKPDDHWVIIIAGVGHRRDGTSFRRTHCGEEPAGSWIIAEQKSRTVLPRCPRCFP